MRKVILLISFLTFSIGFSQEKNEKLYVNNNQNVLLYFDSPIIQGITGNSNFQFAFDKENKNKYGVLRGVKGVDSNLHIITDNGNVYSFVLVHRINISKFNYFISSKLAVGNINTLDNKTILRRKNNDERNDLKEKNTISNSKKEKLEKQKYNSKEFENNQFQKTKRELRILRRKEKDLNTLYKTDKEEYYRKHSLYFTINKPFFKRFFVKSGDVLLFLEEIEYDKDELYFRFRIENNSGIDYDVNFVDFSKVGNKKTKKSSLQKIEIPYEYEFYPFKKISAKSIKQAVYVFKKFGLNADKKFVISVNEKKGERNLILEIPSKFINNAR